MLSNVRWERFAAGVAEGKPASRAYIDAGFRATGNAAEVNAARLLRNAQVAGRVAELRAKASVHAEVDAADVLRGFAELAFVDLGGIIQWDGNTITVTPSADLTVAQRNAVKKVKWTRTAERVQFELELHDRKGALDSLARVLGMNRDSIDINLVRRLGAEWGLTDDEMDAAVREAEAIARGKVAP